MRRFRRIFPALFVMMAVFLGPGSFACSCRWTSCVRQISRVGDLRLQLPFVWAAAISTPLAPASAAPRGLRRRAILLSLPSSAACPPLGWPAWCWSSSLSLFFACVLVRSYVDPAADFYLAPTRGWELMLGALLATGIVPSAKSQVLREAVAVVGLTLIVYALFGFSSATPFPGASALIPCLGAALLIYCGQGEKISIVSKALSLGPVAFVGLISYSLYLWHWPLLVFARYWNIHELSSAQAASIVTASFVLAAFSWAYVEQPFRHKQTLISRQLLFAGAATAVVVVIVGGMLDVRSRGFPGRLSPEALAIARSAKTPDVEKALQRSCTLARPDNRCVVGAQVQPSYAIWGDSHAIAMVPALAEMAGQHGKSIKAFVADGCPPVFWGASRRTLRLVLCTKRRSRPRVRSIARDRIRHSDFPLCPIHKRQNGTGLRGRMVPKG